MSGAGGSERLQHALDFLDHDQPLPQATMVVVYGDDDFLRQQVLAKLMAQLAQVAADDVPPFSRYDGDRCQWRDVADELSTSSLFGGGANLVLLENGDKFVSNHRAQLEELAERGASRGVLLLAVKTWPRNTRLAKQVEKTGLAITCKAPEKSQRFGTSLDTARLAKWLERRAQWVHEFEFARGAAAELVELVGTPLGLLDQEMAKLALYAGRGGTVTRQMVVDYVGGWKTKTTWDLLDAATEGRAADALVELDHLLQSGDVPIALHGAFAWSLRRFAAATRQVQRMQRNGERVNLPDALLASGFRAGRELDHAEQQLRQIGRTRGASLFRDLLRADLQLKGSHSTADRGRWVLERMILQLARQAQPARTTAD